MFESFDIGNQEVDLPDTGKTTQTTIFEDDYTASIFWHHDFDGSVEVHYNTRTTQMGNLAFTRVDSPFLPKGGSIHTVK